MVDRINQAGLGKAVLNLDTIGAAAHTSLAFQQTVIDMQKIAENLLRPAIEAMARWQELIQNTLKQIKEMIEAWIKPLTFLVTPGPIYYVPPQRVTEASPSDKYLPVTRDDYGYFVLGGKRLTRLHPSSSRPGKLLAFLLRHRSQLIDYDTLRSIVGSGNLEKDFKSLKYQLKLQGYRIDYVRPRTSGISLHGLLVLQ